MQQIHSTGSPEFLPARIGNELPDIMTSLEMADLVEKRHDNVKRTIDSLAEKGLIQRPQIEEVTNHLGQTVELYKVGERDSYVVVARLSPEFTARLVDFWRKHRNQQVALPTTAQAFANVFQMVADQERRHAEHAQELKAITAKVERIEETNLLKVKPQNAESITEIRKRIGPKCGLPARIIDIVIAQLPYSPKPAGMVKNSHENAEGSSFAVYWVRDVTHVFKVFTSECKQVSPANWTHPFIEGKFKRVKPTA